MYIYVYMSICIYIYVYINMYNYVYVMCISNIFLKFVMLIDTTKEHDSP